MNRWAYGLLVLFLVPVQTTWLDAMSLNGIKPNLALLLIYFTGFYADEVGGLWAGVVAGFLLDLFSGGPFGLNMTTLALMGLLSGLLGGVFINTTAILTMGMIFILSILNGILTFSYHQWIVGGMTFIEVFRWTILPETLYNAVIGGVLFFAGVRGLGIKRAGPDAAPFSSSIGSM